jgi:hypothetical protein
MELMGSVIRLRQGYGASGIKGKVAVKRASFKSDKILAIAPWIFATVSATSHAQRFRTDRCCKCEK